LLRNIRFTDIANKERNAMTRFGVAKDYDYSREHKRERLTIWSGPFASVFEAVAYSLPNGNGYMLTTYHGGKVRVTCPTPREDNTYERIDSAINSALNAHFNNGGL
jgi:hypothetical protein